MLLSGYDIRRLIDVRRVPRSRRLPHFTADALEKSLERESIVYTHVPDLGGWRRTRDASPNAGWRNPSFRAYADHMGTPEFTRALEHVVAVASERPAALMCAEALWWRCHRRLISDALVVRGRAVRHIRADGEVELHTLTPMALVDGASLTYPPGQGMLGT